MKRDFSKPVTDIDGNVMPDLTGLTLKDGDPIPLNRPPFTVGKAISNALAFPSETQSFATTIRCIELSIRLRPGGLQDIDAEDAKLILDKVHEAYKRSMGGPHLQWVIKRFIDTDPVA